jgi:hypothetical protein
MLLSIPLAARAQTVEVLPGARVRVTVSGALGTRIDGTVLSRTTDSIVVATPQGVQYRIATGSISEFAVSRGKTHSAGAKRGAIWTAAITGPLLVIGAASDPTIDGGEKVGLVLSGTAIYAGIGALIGAVIGAEGWLSLPVQSTPSIAVSGNGFRIGGRLAF